MVSAQEILAAVSRIWIQVIWISVWWFLLRNLLLNSFYWPLVRLTENLFCLFVFPLNPNSGFTSFSLYLISFFPKSKEDRINSVLYFKTFIVLIRASLRISATFYKIYAQHNPDFLLPSLCKYTPNLMLMVALLFLHDKALKISGNFKNME